MGLALDVACVCALTFLVSMLAFLSLPISPAIAAALSFTAGACAGVVAHRLRRRKSRLTRRKKRLLSDRYIKSICYMDADKAHEAIYKLLSAKYPLTDARYESGATVFTHAGSDRAALVVLQKLKSSPDDLLSAWRAHGRARGVSHIIAAVPGRSEQDMRVTAMRLKEPGAVVLDRKQLRSLARRYAPLKEREPEASRMNIIRALPALITRRRAGRYLLYALLLSAYYMATGALAYIIASLTLTAIAAISLRKRAEPDRLI